MARASLEELQLDYEDYLRQHSLPIWDRDDSRRQSLIDRRCASADEVAQWVGEEHDRGRCTQEHSSTRSSQATPGTFPEIAANATLVLLAVASNLLDRQLAAQATAFENEGGFTERLYRVRSEKRASHPLSTKPTESTKSTKG